jgi:hypothetical protein
MMALTIFVRDRKKELYERADATFSFGTSANGVSGIEIISPVPNYSPQPGDSKRSWDEEQTDKKSMQVTATVNPKKIILDKYDKIVRSDVEHTMLGLIIFWACRDTTLYSSMPLHIVMMTFFTTCRIMVTILAVADANSGGTCCQGMFCNNDKARKAFQIMGTIWVIIDMLNGCAGSPFVH